MIQLFTAPEVFATPALAQRYMVELVSTAKEIDAQGVPVPTHTKTVDVVVVEPSLDAIKLLLATAGHLEGYEVVKHWIPEDCDCF